MLCVAAWVWLCLSTEFVALVVTCALEMSGEASSLSAVMARLGYSPKDD